MWLFLVAAIAASWFLLTMIFGKKIGGIATYARNAGFSGDDLVIAVAIALAESSGDPNAIGDKSLAPARGPSLGLWQINMGTQVHAKKFAGHNLFDPQTNANDAFTLYSEAGNTFRDWATFTQTRPGTNDKYYVKFLGDAQSEVQA